MNRGISPECIIQMSSFTHLIITAPNKSIANVYNNQLQSIRINNSALKDVACSCVEDPHGLRVGSGGGTLNALNKAIQKLDLMTIMSMRILIIHSGGDSRRLPFHSITGKAWATLNSTVNNTYASPMALLIEEMNLFCRNLCPGSMVVCCSDVMLDIWRVRINKSCVLEP